MPISNEQVVDSLIAFYKSRGADVSYLFSDPVFTHLPIQDKVEAIKRNAKQIHDSSPVKWNSEEKAGVIGGAVSGALGGVGLGMLATRTFQEGLLGKPLASMMAHNKAIASGIAAATIFGTGVGIMSAYAAGKSKVDARQGLRNQLGLVVKDPSDQNAVGALSIQEQIKRNHTLRDAILGKVSDRVNAGYTTYMEKQLPIQMRTNYDAFTKPISFSETNHQLRSL
jgi:hypothetical protein